MMQLRNIIVFLMMFRFYCAPELVFTELILQILYWIYEIAIHSSIF
jgi:hypothetical protein